LAEKIVENLVEKWWNIFGKMMEYLVEILAENDGKFGGKIDG